MIPSQKPTPRLDKQDLLYAALLLVIGALAYLLFIGRQGLYGDDWYLIYDGHSRGAAFFQTVFNSDRPGRGLLFSALYSLFGDHLILYHLSAFLWRFLASLAFIWSLNMVWNGNRRSNFLAGLFFLVYPGFLSQVQPVDYQPQVFSLCLAMVSIALTVRIFKQPCSWRLKTGLFLLSVLTGWAYLALVEYAVGLEFLRLFFIACLVWQAPGVTTRSKKIKSALLGWLPFVIIPLGFAVWRFFIFNNTRQATDASFQLGRLVDTPLLTAAHWLLNLLNGAFNVLFSAWVVPFYERVIMAGLRLRESLIVLAIGAAALVACLLVERFGRHESAEMGRHASRLAWLGWGGLITVMAAALPVVVTNRTVDLETSRYTLTAAPGAVLVLVALLGHLHSPRIQNWAAALLVSLAVAIHAGNALDQVRQAESLRDFWWQVAWRAPSIKPGTTLVADYALMQAPEEYVIWGPANLVYYPQADVSSVVPLSAALPDMATVNRLTGGGNGYQLDRRGVTVSVEPNQVLVLSQPEGGGCVRLLDCLHISPG